MHFSGSAAAAGMLFKQPKTNPGIAGSWLWSFNLSYPPTIGRLNSLVLEWSETGLNPLNLSQPVSTSVN